MIKCSNVSHRNPESAPTTNHLFLDTQLTFPSNLIQICSHFWDILLTNKKLPETVGSELGTENITSSGGSNNCSVWNWENGFIVIFCFLSFQAKSGYLKMCWFADWANRGYCLSFILLCPNTLINKHGKTNFSLSIMKMRWMKVNNQMTLRWIDSDLVVDAGAIFQQRVSLFPIIRMLVWFQWEIHDTEYEISPYGTHQKRTR